MIVNFKSRELADSLYHVALNRRLFSEDISDGNSSAEKMQSLFLSK